MRHLTLIFTLALTLALPLTLQAQEAPPVGAPPAPAAVEVVAPEAPVPAALPLTPSPSPEVAIPVPVAPAAPADPLAPAKEAAAAAVAETPATPPTTEELLASGSAALKQVVKAVGAEKDAEGVQWVAWAGALAAAFTLLLGLLRRFGGLLLNEQRLRIATLALGLLAGLCGSLALGAPDWAAVVLGLSGPGSMLVYAVIDLFRPGSWAKAAEREAEKKSAPSALVL
jgi:hypothetical protein